MRAWRDRKSTRLNSSHGYISYAVFCLKKKKNKQLLHAQVRAAGSAHRPHTLPGTRRAGIVIERSPPNTRDQNLEIVLVVFFFLMMRRPPRSTLFPSPALFR